MIMSGIYIKGPRILKYEEEYYNHVDYVGYHVFSRHHDQNQINYVLIDRVHIYNTLR